MTHRTCTLGIALFLTAGTAFAQEKVTLKQTYTPGEYDMSMSVNTEGLTSVAGGPTSQPAIAQKTTISMGASMSIGAPDKDGVKKVAFTYRRIAYGMTSGPMSMNFDSDDSNTASSPIGAALKPLVGAKITFETTADGNFQNVKGMEEIWDAMAKGSPGMAAAAEQMKKEFGGEQLKEMMMSAAAGYLPAAPVAVGEAWKSSIKMNAPTVGPMTLDANCRLAGVEKAPGGGRALIDIESTGALNKPTERKVGETTLTVQRMDMHQKGQLTFDMARNMISATKTTGEVVTEMTMSARNGQNLAMSSKQTLVTDITITPAE